MIGAMHSQADIYNHIAAHTQVMAHGVTLPHVAHAVLRIQQYTYQYMFIAT